MLVRVSVRGGRCKQWNLLRLVSASARLYFVILGFIEPFNRGQIVHSTRFAAMFA